MTFDQLAIRSGCTSLQEGARMVGRTMTLECLMALPGVVEAIVAARAADVARLQVAEARRRLEAALYEGTGGDRDYAVAYDLPDGGGTVWPITFTFRDLVVSKHDVYLTATVRAREIRTHSVVRRA